MKDSEQAKHVSNASMKTATRGRRAACGLQGKSAFRTDAAPMKKTGRKDAIGDRDLCRDNALTIPPC